MTVGPAFSASAAPATANVTAETANATARLADSWECGNTRAAWTPAEAAHTKAPKTGARESALRAVIGNAVADREAEERVTVR